MAMELGSESTLRIRLFSAAGSLSILPEPTQAERRNGVISHRFQYSLPEFLCILLAKAGIISLRQIRRFIRNQRIGICVIVTGQICIDYDQVHLLFDIRESTMSKSSLFKLALFCILGPAAILAMFVIFIGPASLSTPTIGNADPDQLTKERQAAIESFNSSFSIQEGIKFRNLEVFAVCSQQPMDNDNYITLAEGLESGQVKIYEKSAQAVTTVESLAQEISTGNDVDRIYVVNKSDKDLYLMPGEIVYGGDQDRCVGREYVVKPDKKRSVPIEVFCVEEGRWGARSEDDTIEQLQVADAINVQNGRLSPQEKAKLANDGQFVASFGNVTNSVRKAAQFDKQQSKVWEEVADVNSQSGVASPSTAFTKNYSDENTLETISDYQDSLLAKIDQQENVVGVIIAVDGKVESMDVFNSSSLFRKLWPRLLKSFALEAASSSKPVSDASLAIEDAQEFVFKSIGTVKSQETDQVGLAVTTRESEEVISMTASHDAPNGAAPADSFEQSVHMSAFAK